MLLLVFPAEPCLPGLLPLVSQFLWKSSFRTSCPHVAHMFLNTIQSFSDLETSAQPLSAHLSETGSLDYRSSAALIMECHCCSLSPATECFLIVSLVLCLWHMAHSHSQCWSGSVLASPLIITYNNHSSHSSGLSWAYVDTWFSFACAISGYVMNI